MAVKRYILLKRKKAQEERKRKEREEKARKEQIKNRLVALEQERRNDYVSGIKKILPNLAFGNFDNTGMCVCVCTV